MKRQTVQWIRKAEEYWEGANELAARNLPLPDLACFHCQQAAEKYLKALLQESGAAVPRTHDLEDLLDLLLPHAVSLARLRRGLASLGRYAVDYRYPGRTATRRNMQSALRHADRLRREVRTRLGVAL